MQTIRRISLALSLILATALQAEDINTTGGATITGPYNIGFNDTVSNITGNGTLTLNGTGVIGLANNGGGRTVNMSMTGGLIDIGSGVILQNGGWASGVWTSNLSSLNVASGGTMDVWDGNAVRVDALTGAGTVTITPFFGAGWAGGRSFVMGVNNGGGTFTGTIAGNSSVDGGNLSVTKEGTGTQILTGTNTYNGTTTISGGTLQIGNGGSTGTIGTGNITNNAALVFNRSGTSTVAGSISGSGSLTTNGTGTFILDANNSYSGATTINTGSTLQIGNGGGTGSLGTASTATNDGTLAFNLNGNRNLDKVISGSGSVSYAGGATYEPTVNQSYTGTTTITSSQVIASGDARLGTAPATPTVSIIMDGGSIFNGNFATTLDANRTIQLNAGGGQFRAGYGQTFTVNGKLTGAGSLSLNWDGAPLVLANAANDYAGDTVIGIVGAGAYTPGGAQLRMGVTNALPYGAGKGNLVLNTNADTPGANSNLDLNGFNTQVNGLNGTSAGRIYSSSAATLTVGNNDQNGNFAGLIQSNASLAKVGSGTQILSGDNSYSGTTTISAGTLQIGDGGTTGALGAGNVTNDATLTFNRSNDYAVSNGMTGSGNVIKNAAGTITFTNATNYNGTTTVNAGVLELSVGGPGGTLAGSGPIVINNGGTLRGNQTDALGYNNYSATNGITINEGGTLTTHNGHRYSNDRSITSIGGTVTSSGTGFSSGASYTMRSWNGASYNFTSATSGTPSTISATDFGLQGDVNFNVTDGPGAVDLNVTGNIVNVFGQGNLIKSGAGAMLLAADNTYTGPTTISGGTLQVGNGGSTGSLGAGAITNNAALVFNRSDTTALSAGISGTGSVTKEGSGTHTLSGSLSYTGLTTVNGGRLVLENSITGSSNYTTNAELEFKVTAGTKQLNGGTISGTGTLIKTGNDQLMLGANGSPQTMAMTGANSLIDVQGGALRNEYGNSAWGSNQAGLNVASGAVFDIWDGDTTVDELTGSGIINKGWSNNNSLTIGVNNGSGTFTGVIENNRTDLGYGGNAGGALSLVKEGTGTQTLSGSNTYSGGTTVNGGTLSLNSTGGNSAIRGVLTVNAGGTVVSTGDGTGLGYNNPASIGTLNINGGTVTSAGAVHIWSTMTGGVNMTGGTLQSNNGTSNAGGAQLEWGNVPVTTNTSASTATIGGRINIRAEQTSSVLFTVADGAAATDLHVSAAITSANGSAGITKAGPGTAEFSHGIASGGDINNTSGALILSGSQPFNAGQLLTTGGSSTTLTNGASLTVNQLVFGIGGQNETIGGTMNVGSGTTLTVSGAARLGDSNGGGSVTTGTINQTGGTVNINAPNTDGRNFVLGHWNATQGNYNLSGGTLNAPNISMAISWDGDGTFNLSGTGTANVLGLRFGHNNARTGVFNLTGGTLSLGTEGIWAENAGHPSDINLGGGTIRAAANTSISLPTELTGTGGDTTFDTNGNTLSVPAAMSGAGGLIKTGAGTLQLSTNNTYSGPTTFSGGTVSLATGRIYSNNNWTARQITINGGATVEVGGWGDGASAGFGQVDFTSANILVNNGTIRYTGGYEGGSTDRGFKIGAGGATLDAAGGANIFTLNQGRGFGLSSTDGGTLTLTGSSNGVINLNLGGTGALVKTGTGIWSVTGSNSYSGTTTINAGTIEATANNALGTAAGGTSVANGATLELNNVNYTTAEPLSINGAGTSSSGALKNTGTSSYAGTITAATNATINAGGGTLTTTGGLVKNGTTLTIAGGGKVIVNGTGISGSAANSDLVVDGTTLVVNANSNYNGPTTVQNSAVLVANATVQSTTVTINAGTTLSGTGRVESDTNNFIYINGTLQVGDSTLGSPVASQLELATSGSGATVTGLGSTLSFDLFSNAGNNTGIVSSSDRIRLFGSLDSALGGTLFLSNPNGLTGFAATDSWKLFDLSGGGSISTDFALNYSSLSLSPGLSGSFDRTSGVFSIIGVPEPSRALLLMLGASGMMLRRRRALFEA